MSKSTSGPWRTQPRVVAFVSKFGMILFAKPPFLALGCGLSAGFFHEGWPVGLGVRLLIVATDGPWTKQCRQAERVLVPPGW